MDATGLKRTLCAVTLTVLAACATDPTATPPEAPEASREAPADSRAHRSPFIEPPGVLFGDVTQATVKTTICVAGWTATVRPSTSYTQGVKRKLLRDAGAPETESIKYELDHFVPLALGGHPRSLDNLWLQEWDGPWNARVKDRLERNLQLMVCAGKLTLHSARTAIQNDWKAAHQKYIGNVPAPRDMEEQEVVE